MHHNWETNRNIFCFLGTSDTDKMFVCSHRSSFLPGFVLHSILCFIQGIISKNNLERKTSVILPLLKQTFQKKTKQKSYLSKCICSMPSPNRNFQAFIFFGCLSVAGLCGHKNKCIGHEQFSAPHSWAFYVTSSLCELYSYSTFGHFHERYQVTYLTNTPQSMLAARFFPMQLVILWAFALLNSQWVKI